MRFQFADSWSSVPVVSRVPTGSAGALLSSNSSRRRRSRARRRYRRDPGCRRGLSDGSPRTHAAARISTSRRRAPPSGGDAWPTLSRRCIGNIRLVRPGAARYRLWFGGHSRRGLAFFSGQAASPDFRFACQRLGGTSRCRPFPPSTHPRPAGKVGEMPLLLALQDQALAASPTTSGSAASTWCSSASSTSPRGASAADSWSSPRARPLLASLRSLGSNVGLRSASSSPA
jgi:hypothetical protein